MSELKAYIAYEADDFPDETEFYLKSEADKVIAGLKEHVKGLILDNYLKDKELRHQKYKRCLWLARWCASRSASWCLDPADDELHKSDFYDKWKLRWLALAENFKPNSTAQ